MQACSEKHLQEPPDQAPCSRQQGLCDRVTAHSLGSRGCNHPRRPPCQQPSCGNLPKSIPTAPHLVVGGQGALGTPSPKAPLRVGCGGDTAGVTQVRGPGTRTSGHPGPTPAESAAGLQASVSPAVKRARVLAAPEAAKQTRRGSERWRASLKGRSVAQHQAAAPGACARGQGRVPLAEWVCGRVRQLQDHHTQGGPLSLLPGRLGVPRSFSGQAGPMARPLRPGLAGGGAGFLPLPPQTTPWHGSPSDKWKHGPGRRG